MWQDVVNLLRRLGLLRPMENFVVPLTGYSIMGRMITWNEGVPYVDSLMLRSVGAKSGDLRDAVLFYVPDGDSWVIIGSVGGGPKHPAWVHNLRANPTHGSSSTASASPSRQSSSTVKIANAFGPQRLKSGRPTSSTPSARSHARSK